MKMFRMGGRCKLLLCLSVCLNLLLVALVFVAERQGRVWGMALERRNIITLSDMVHPDYWTRVGWQNTIEKLNVGFDVAFFGNSITRGSDFQRDFPDKRIINLGLPGDNMVGMLHRVPMLQAARPKKVFVMAGTNDLVHISLDDYKRRYVALLKAIRDSLPEARIYLESVLPSNSALGDFAPNEKVQAANRIAGDLAKSYGCTFVNLYDLYADEHNELPRELTRDGVHLFPEHYDRWAKKIRPLVYE